MKKIFILITLINALMLSDNTSAWEPYDRVIAVVNAKPIIESDIVNKFNQVKKFENIRISQYNEHKSRILDTFIENILVDETAENESILISTKKVVLHVEKLMREYFSKDIDNGKELNKLIEDLSERLRMRLDDEIFKKDSRVDNKLNEFIEFIESKQNIDFMTMINEIRSQMKREQVIQITIGVSPPTKEEVENWYRENKNKLGYEVRVKHILIMPRNNSLDEQRKANDLISDLRKRIIAGESFENIARKYSHDRASARRGGDIGWSILATMDKYFAGHVFRMSKYGEISRVFKSGFGYHIVKFLGKRVVQFSSVERMIMIRLYNEKVMFQFKKWVTRRKKESSITIFMDNYIKG